MQDERQHNEVTLGSKDKPITVGSIRVDRSHLQVSVDGKTLSLTVRESLLLHFLAVHANTVCTFGQIGSQVEGFTNDGATGFIKAYIHRLRLKIEPDPMHPIYLLTIPEVGYTLVSHDQEGAKQIAKGVKAPMLLNYRYLIQDSIGRGPISIIYRGIDTHTDQDVAIKVLRETYSSDPKFVIRFQREAKVMSSLQHPNIVPVYNYGQTDGNYFIVMELIEGTDLRRYLRSRGILDAENTVKIAHNIALGLGEAHHRGVIHRNVRPTNILLGRYGSIKLTDFSIANINGTVQYYGIEQIPGEIVIPATDIYAMGIVMYQMLTGHPPFDGDSPVVVAMKHIHDTPKLPSQFNPNIPAVLEEIIMRCLEKMPDMRFRDGSELARALKSLAESLHE